MPQDPRSRELARQLAEDARVNRAKLRRELKKEGTVDPMALLEGNEPQWEEIARRQPIFKLLCFIDGIGPITAAEILIEARKSMPDLQAETRLGLLTFALRQEIADLLRRVLNPASV